jgi:hypothetical protein
MILARLSTIPYYRESGSSRHDEQHYLKHSFTEFKPQKIDRHSERKKTVTAKKRPTAQKVFAGNSNH